MPLYISVSLLSEVITARKLAEISAIKEHAKLSCVRELPDPMRQVKLFLVPRARITPGLTLLSNRDAK